MLLVVNTNSPLRCWNTKCTYAVSYLKGKETDSVQREKSLNEFSQNFNVEILENLESVKTTPETKYKIFFKINIQGFCYKEILNIF